MAQVRSRPAQTPQTLAESRVGLRGRQRTFNDGYHLEHHVNSRRHWTEVPPAGPHPSHFGRHPSHLARIRVAWRMP